MSKLWSESDLSDSLDGNLTSRIRELSDLKQAIRDASNLNRAVLLKAVVALAYAHWEGFVKFSAQKYFEYITIRRLQFSSMHPQIYANSFLIRLNAFSNSKPSLEEKLQLISDILNSHEKRFSFINPDLINTGSNLKSDTLREICLICGIDYEKKFSDKKTFIDLILLKRRNSIAHGDEAIISIDEIDNLVETVTGLMRTFKNELENKIYLKEYLVRQPT